MHLTNTCRYVYRNDTDYYFHFQELTDNMRDNPNVVQIHLGMWFSGDSVDYAISKELMHTCLVWWRSKFNFMS